MPVTYQQARQHVGQRVVLHGVDGQRHFGVLQNVNPQGVYIRPMQMGMQASAESAEINIDLADQPQTVEGEQVFFGAFFLPFLALAALWPWYAYPYWGGYYW